MKTQKLIAITGTAGSGKTSVGNYLKKKGFSVFDCDQISRQVAELPETVKAVETLLGSDFVVDGKLNRAKIRQKIFSDTTVLNSYNNIFMQKIQSILLEKIKNDNSNIIFVEIPLINAIELNWQEIWQVKADFSQQIHRVTIRDNVSAENVMEMLKNQPQIQHPTKILDNSRDLAFLYSQIDKLLSTF